MKKILGSMIVAVFMLVLPIVAYAESTPYATPLIAGGGNPKSAVEVGEVRIWNEGGFLKVQYMIDADLTPNDPTDDGVPTLLYETHLYVAESLAAIPQKNGNPIPGQFKPFSKVHHPGVTTYTYTIPIPKFETPLYVAAHAVVKKLGGMAGLELALPNQATIQVTYPTPEGPSYFPTVTVTDDGALNGVYNGWCIDTDHVIYQGTKYTAKVYSSSEMLPGGYVEQPGNFDLINWIINQNYVGRPSPGDYGVYTYGDVQRAIWTLIDDQVSTSGLGSWSQNRVNEILAAAQKGGQGFVPGCGQEVAVVLAPVASAQVIIAQVIFAEVDVPCATSSETAWGDGFAFEGKNWAKYIIYTAQ